MTMISTPSVPKILGEDKVSESSISILPDPTHVNPPKGLQVSMLHEVPKSFENSFTNICQIDFFNRVPDVFGKRSSASCVRKDRLQGYP